MSDINNLREEAVLFCTMAFQRYFVHYSVYSGKQCIIENFTPQHSGPEAEKGGYWWSDSLLPNPLLFCAGPHL